MILIRIATAAASGIDIDLASIRTPWLSEHDILRDEDTGQAYHLVSVIDGMVWDLRPIGVPSEAVV